MKFIAIIFILLAIMSAILIFIDTRRNPQSMRVMNAVWILTGLWSGLLGLFAYYKFGREVSNPSLAISDNSESDKTTGMSGDMDRNTGANSSSSQNKNDVSKASDVNNSRPMHQPMSCDRHSSCEIHSGHTDDISKSEIHDGSSMTKEADDMHSMNMKDGVMGDMSMKGMDMGGESESKPKMGGMAMDGNMSMKGMDMSGESESKPKMGGMAMGGMSMKGMDMGGESESKPKMGGMAMGGMSMKGMDMGGESESKPQMGGMAMGDMSMKSMDMGGMKMTKHSHWQSVVLSTLHCGAGCTLADIVGEIIVTLIPMAIGGSIIAGGWAFDYVVALIFGVYFQYLAIKQINGKMSNITILKKAIHADFLSLTSWQIGMYGWMALVYFVFYAQTGIVRLSWEFWFMMQIAMLCGFLTALPVNVWLIKKGIKSGM